MTKPITKSFEPIYGEPCWGLQFGQYTNLRMHFGQPTLKVDEPFETSSKSDALRRMAARRRIRIRGQWRLLLWCCYWRLSLHCELLATGSASLRRINRAIHHLEGQKLKDVRVAPATGASRFVFDLGCVLECRRFEKDDSSELWSLYKPNGFVLSVCGNGTYSHQRGSTKPSGKRYRPIK